MLNIATLILFQFRCALILTTYSGCFLDYFTDTLFDICYNDLLMNKAFKNVHKLIFLQVVN